MRANKYQVVHRISDVIAQTADPWDGLKQVTRIISESVDNAPCALFAYNQPSETITLVASHGVGEELVGKLNFGIDKGLTGLAVRTGRILNLDDQCAHSENVDPPPPIGGDFHGLLVVPLVVGGSTIGTLDITRPQKRKFGRRILDMVQEIATPLAVFIVNTMLVRQTFETDDAFSLQRPRKIEHSLQDKPMRGRPITSGVVCGRAIMISGIDELLAVRRIPQPVNTTPEAIDAERQLFQTALDVARRTSQRTAREMQQILTEADCNIFAMHAMLLDDPTLKKTILKHIDEGHTIDTSLAAALRTFSAQYMKIEDVYLRERFCDIKDVLLNLKNATANLRGRIQPRREEGLPTKPNRIIVVARELLPSQLVSLPLKKVAGIVCEDGGSTSHVAILARALQMPMVVGIQGLTDVVRPGDSMLLDCNTGNCFLHPRIDLIKRYSEPLRITHERQLNRGQQPRTEVCREVKTADGQEVFFCGNLALLSELPTIQHYGLREIGLYRTEFMFMIRNELPTEEEQTNVLKKLVGDAGVPVTIRLLDAGGDKPIPYLNLWHQEDNPSLGWRGLRFLLSNPQILMPHLRAILRAGAAGKMNILIPMVADLFDLLKLKEALKEAEMELRSKGIPFNTDYRLGIMLEIPSAYIGLRDMLPHIDFVSIGTNDLVQFLFAVDRGNPRVTQWYRQCHPIILKIIRDVCHTVADFPGKSVCLCGELAGSRRALPLLLGAGLRRFSMTPSRVPELKQLVTAFNSERCEQLLDEVLNTCDTDMEVRAYLEKHGMTP